MVRSDIIVPPTQIYYKKLLINYSKLVTKLFDIYSESKKSVKQDFAFRVTPNAS